MPRERAAPSSGSSAVSIPATCAWHSSQLRRPDEKRFTYARFYAQLRLGRHGGVRPIVVRPCAGRRVDGFATVEQWERGYEEIVHFERSLALEGTVLVKLWLHISARSNCVASRAVGRSAEGMEAHRRRLAQPCGAPTRRRSPTC